MGAPLKDAFQQPQLLQEASQEAKDALRCQTRVRFVGGWVVGWWLYFLHMAHPRNQPTKRKKKTDHVMQGAMEQLEGSF